MGRSLLPASGPAARSRARAAARANTGCGHCCGRDRYCDRAAVLAAATHHGRTGVALARDEGYPFRVLAASFLGASLLGASLLGASLLGVAHFLGDHRAEGDE